jgi:hypothetical protein
MTKGRMRAVKIIKKKYNDENMKDVNRFRRPENGGA